MIALLAERVPWLVILWLSLTVHEWAHARAAYALGDDTARAQGRMTLDPFAHVDPVGTLLLPLVGVPFGWARPVPVNPAQFDRRVPMSFGLLLTAVAGPVSNVVLAVGFAIVFVAMPDALRALPVASTVAHLVRAAVALNLLLAAFNLFPIPPLDGSRVVAHLLPRSLRGAWEALEGYGTWLPFAALVLLTVLGLSPLPWIVRTAEALLDAAAG